MLGHHLPPTIGRFESILEAWPDVPQSNIVDTSLHFACPNLSQDEKTRQSLSK
jgi:hypothetical protein